MFERILVPMDGSDFSWSALEHAIELAEDEKDPIHLLYVVDERLVEAPFLIATATDSLLPEVHPEFVEMALQIQKKLQEQGEKILAQAKARCEEKGIPCSSEITEGHVTRIILDKAKDAGLIVMGREGSGARWGGPLLGSTFEAIVRHAPVPVLGVQKEVRPIRRILVAYDGSDRAEDALEIAIALAHRGREIVLVTVDDGKKDRIGAYDKARQRLVEEGVIFTAVFRSGHVAEAILEVAQETESDLIAMGAYGHRFFLDIFFGGTVEEVMRRTTLPILICR